MIPSIHSQNFDIEKYDCARLPTMLFNANSTQVFTQPQEWLIKEKVVQSTPASFQTLIYSLILIQVI